MDDISNWPINLMREIANTLNAETDNLLNEHTQRWQIGFSSTFSPSRNALALPPLITLSRLVPDKLPIGGWKKHGRTSPLVSTTADTQGALHLGATCNWSL